ncbi:MAG: HEAT repeat domain-containing protein [Chloroflexi bacterium]|nr:HEAT repeat domain-containing protein [Chloroflexota bacterium]
MTTEGKVLTGFMDRRALEAEFRALAEADDFETVKVRAGRIAQRGTDAVLPVFLNMLDTTDPQLRGGLGQVATLLERDRIVAALRGVARSRERPEQARLGALTILERFLKEPVDESLVIGLRDPNAVALQSLSELIQEMERAPVAIIEYLNQLAEQPPEVPRMLLDAIPLLPSNPHLITLLRMFAQGPDPRLAQTAVEQLGRIRQPEAIAALTSLAATLPPSLAPLADRSARKLRMSGVAFPATGEGSWRVLMSPIDGTGAQVTWFVRHADDQPHGLLLGVLTQDPKGIIVGFGSPEVPAENLPPAQPVGTIFPVAQADDAPPIIMLETPFEAARAVLRQAHEQNWASETPLPIEYRLLDAWIWEIPLPRPGMPGSRGAEGQEAEESTAASRHPNAPTETAALLDHPAFVTWFWQTPGVQAAARKLGPQHLLAARTAQITALAEAEFGPDVRESYCRRLEGMAEWLTIAGQPETARLAQAAADELAAHPPAESPFVRRMIGIGLDVAAISLRGKPRLRRAK